MFFEILCVGILAATGSSHYLEYLESKKPQTQEQSTSTKELASTKDMPSSGVKACCPATFDKKRSSEVKESPKLPPLHRRIHSKL